MDNNSRDMNDDGDDQASDSSDSSSDNIGVPLELHICKMHGCANDFVIFHIDSLRNEVTQERVLPSIQDLQRIARYLCDRSTGIGADHLIVITPPPPHVVHAHFQMLLFNNDGSMAENSGNGIRCILKFIIDYQIKPYKLDINLNNNINNNNNLHNNVGLGSSIDQFPNNNKHLIPFFRYNRSNSGETRNPYLYIPQECVNIYTMAGIMRCCSLPSHPQNTSKSLWVSVCMGHPYVVQTIGVTKEFDSNNNVNNNNNSSTNNISYNNNNNNFNSFSPSSSPLSASPSFFFQHLNLNCSIKQQQQQQQTNLSSNPSNTNNINNNSNSNDQFIFNNNSNNSIHSCCSESSVNTCNHVGVGSKYKILSTRSKTEDYCKMIPFKGHFINTTLVSMGNPHCVVHLENVVDFPLDYYGELIENHPMFPEKTNVEFVEIINPNLIRAKVWQRGCGMTSACGTGACAIVVAGVLKSKNDRKATVQMDGGELVVEWRAQDDLVYQSGPATTIFEGTVRFFLSDLD